MTKNKGLAKFISAFISALIPLCAFLFVSCDRSGENAGLPNISPFAAEAPAQTLPPVFEERYILADALTKKYELFSIIYPSDEEMAEIQSRTEPFEAGFILPKGWRCRVKRAEGKPLPAVCRGLTAPVYFYEIYDEAGRLSGALAFHTYKAVIPGGGNDYKRIYGAITGSGEDAAENCFLINDRYEPISCAGDNITALTDVFYPVCYGAGSSGSDVNANRGYGIVSYDPLREVYLVMELFPGHMDYPQLSVIAESVRIY